MAQPILKDIDGVKWAYVTPAGQGRAVLCRPSDYPKFEEIKKRATKDYHMLYLYKQATGLGANIGSVDNLVSKFFVTKRKLKLEGGSLAYEIRGGDVLLTRFDWDPDYRKNQAKMGLYSVRNNKPDYKTKQANSITTQHAAINGIVGNLQEAASLMPTFINEGYKEERLAEGAKYTLFYNPYHGFFDADFKCIQDSTGLRGGTQAARQLASAMEMAAEKKQTVNWTVHERGCAIFMQALRLAPTGLDYSKQTVFYANPVVMLERIDEQRKRLGMQISKASHTFNEMSIHQGLIAGNWVSDVAMQWQKRDVGGFLNSLARPGRLASAVMIMGALPSGVAAAGWVAGLAATLGPNLFSSHFNKGVISGAKDTINHTIKAFKPS